MIHIDFSFSASKTSEWQWAFDIPSGLTWAEGTGEEEWRNQVLGLQRKYGCRFVMSGHPSGAPGTVIGPLSGRAHDDLIGVYYHPYPIGPRHRTLVCKCFQGK
jgi:hypothetical protein